VQTIALTLIALVAFAANSLLCRLALGGHLIDATTFTTIRLGSGAAMLAALQGLRRGAITGSWISALWLFVYALPFSLAYFTLTAGTGALILFGAVQITMLTMAIAAGSPPNRWETLGILSAVAGLSYLVWPGLAAPSPSGAALMAVAGAAWGVYTLRGRRMSDPLALTAGNFVRAAPLAAVVSLASVARVEVHPSGVILAAVSGAVTSGLGYVIWYTALPHLTAVRAAAVQLGVPILAAIGGVVFLDETVTSRLGFGAVLVLGGVALALFGRRRTA
jgi:drug/metabolite transporter (DMT)-like permease